MANDAIASNLLVKERSQQLRQFLLVGHTFGLYQNDYTPTVASTWANLVECSFPGYHRISTAGRLSVPSKVLDGKYQFNSDTLTVICTAPTNEKAYGWFLADGFLVKFTGRFDLPFDLGTGIAVTWAVTLQEWALSIL